MSQTVAAGIYAKLTGTAGVSALTSTRIYPAWSPEILAAESISPTVVFSLVNGEPEQTYRQTTMRVESWEFVCLASVYDTAHQLADAVTAALDFVRETWGSVKVSCRFARMTDEVVASADLGVYSVVVEIEIRWTA